MAMKVDKATFVVPRPPQNTINSSPSALTASPKVSKFGLKSGFVIPKNKLSGSLVPVFQGAGKVENDAVKEESNKQIQRKTKWGTDLTQDATVRRGRALAYQTRVEQITKQLMLGVPEKGDSDLSSQSPNQASNEEPTRDQADDQSQKLEIEKREAIGEILKLNPSYKAPVDYKPLMKEANILIPVKLNPGLNFVSLILGPGSNTQKRLEEETGARIQIQGTKAGSAEKVEITLSDKNDVQGAYEELYVHVSADTYEKVDAAVALIDLLVTPVAGNYVTASTAPSSVSGDTRTVLDHSQDTYNFVMPGNVINQGMMQSTMGPMQSAHLPQNQFHPYPAPWFPSGPMRPPNNFGPPPNSSAPMPNSVIQFPTSRMPQFLAGPHSSATGSGFAPRNLASTGLQPPLQGFQWPYLREAPPHAQGPPVSTYPTAGSHPHLIYPSVRSQPNFAVPHQGTINQQRATGPGSMLPSLSQPLSPMGQPPNRPLASSGWSASTVATPPQSFGLFQRPPVASQPLVTASSNVPTTLQSGSSGNMVPPASFPSRPSTAQSPNTLGNHPSTVPNFSFVIHQRSPSALSPGLLPSSVPFSPLGAPAPASSLSLNQCSPVPRMQQVGPQGLVPNQSNPATTQKPQQPSFGDFTFQPLGSTTSVTQAVPRASEQPSKAPPMSSISLVQPPPAPFYRPTPQLVMQGFPSTRPSNQMVQSPSQVPPSLSLTSPYSGNPRFLEFAIQNPVSPLASVPRMGPRSFVQAPVVSNFRGPFQPQMINAPHNQTGSFLITNQLCNNVPFPSGKPASSQVYDPFSGTWQPEKQIKDSKQEDDPEYNDFMASVGLR